MTEECRLKAKDKATLRAITATLLNVDTGRWLHQSSYKWKQHIAAAGYCLQKGTAWRHIDYWAWIVDYGGEILDDVKPGESRNVARQALYNLEILIKERGVTSTPWPYELHAFMKKVMCVDTAQKLLSVIYSAGSGQEGYFTRAGISYLENILGDCTKKLREAETEKERIRVCETVMKRLHSVINAWENSHVKDKAG